MGCCCVKVVGILLLVLVFWGCHSISLKDEKEIARKSEIILHIASLNLGNFNKRIEQKYIIELAKVLKCEQVEVLAVQGTSRYPGVAARVDFVVELSAQTDWRNAVGELMVFLAFKPAMLFFIPIQFFRNTIKHSII